MAQLNGMGDKIDAHSYPATTEELIEEYGDHMLEYPNGEETFGEALSRLGSTTFQDAEDARLATYSVMSSGAIGRKGYSDRDPVAPGERGPDAVSF